MLKSYKLIVIFVIIDELKLANWFYENVKNLIYLEGARLL